MHLKDATWDGMGGRQARRDKATINNGQAADRVSRPSVMRFHARIHPRARMRGRRTPPAVRPNDRAGRAREDAGCGTCSAARAAAPAGAAALRRRQPALGDGRVLRAPDAASVRLPRVRGARHEPDVLVVLARVAGANLTAIDLAHCRRLGAADVEQVLARATAACPRVAEVHVTGCSTCDIVQAVTVCARDAHAAALPLDLYVLLEALCRAGERRMKRRRRGSGGGAHAAMRAAVDVPVARKLLAVRAWNHRNCPARAPEAQVGALRASVAHSSKLMAVRA